MTIFWTLRSIPELANQPASERRVNWRRASHRSWRHWQTWAGLLVCAICAGVGAGLGAFAAHRIVGAIIGGGVGGFVFGQTIVRVARSHYRNILQGLDS